MFEGCRHEPIGMTVFELTADLALTTRMDTTSPSFINVGIYSTISDFILRPIHILTKNGYARQRVERSRCIRNSHKGTGHAYGRLITV